MRGLLIVSVLLAVAASCNNVPKTEPPTRPITLVEPEPEFENEFDRLVWMLGHKNFNKRREAQAIARSQS